jgi:hypothetical protein
MQTLNLKMLWQKAALTKVDIGWAFAVTVLFAGVTVIFSIIDALDVYGAKRTLTLMIGDKLNTFLTWLDSLELTATVVTFVFWGFVGLIAYSIVNGLLKVRQEIDYEQELTSDEYVRPAARTKGDIVRGEISSNVAFGLTGLIAILMSGCFVILVLPMVALYSRMLGLQLTAENGAYLAAAVTLLWMTTCAVIWTWKVFIHRHVLFSAA